MLLLNRKRKSCAQDSSSSTKRWDTYNRTTTCSLLKIWWSDKVLYEKRVSGLLLLRMQADTNCDWLDGQLLQKVQHYYRPQLAELFDEFIVARNIPHPISWTNLRHKVLHWPSTVQDLPKRYVGGCTSAQFIKYLLNRTYLKDKIFRSWWISERNSFKAYQTLHRKAHRSCVGDRRLTQHILEDFSRRTHAFHQTSEYCTQILNNECYSTHPLEIVLARAFRSARREKTKKVSGRSKKKSIFICEACIIHIRCQVHTERGFKDGKRSKFDSTWTACSLNGA